MTKRLRGLGMFKWGGREELWKGGECAHQQPRKTGSLYFIPIIPDSRAKGEISICTSSLSSGDQVLVISLAVWRLNRVQKKREMRFKMAALFDSVI